MKSIVFRVMLVVAAFAIVPDGLAADTGGGNFFVDVREGKIVGKPLGNDSGYSAGSQSSWGGDGGYRWRLDDQRSAGFEVGYMHFGKVADESGNFGRSQLSASAISLGGNLQVLFGDDRATIFQVRGGLTSVKFDDYFTSFFAPSGTDSWR